MNVWNYIYISFFNVHRKIIGHAGADKYAAMLFVASLDCLFYYGMITLIDGLTGYHLLNGNRLWFAILIIGGCLVIERIRNSTLCKKGFFEHVKKEVEEESNKFLWKAFSIIYIFLALSFFVLSMYLWSHRVIPVLVVK